MRPTWLTVLFMILSSSLIGAQDSPALKQELNGLRPETRRLVVSTEPAEAFDLLTEIRDNFWKQVLLYEGTQETAKLLAFSRGDLQTGANSGGSGSTSTVLNPVLPAIFGMAFEDGAITRTVSGTTITLKVNPAGLVCAANEQRSHAVAVRAREACRTLWSRLGIAASFDASRGEKNTELVGFTTLGSQLSEVTVRWEVLNRRDVTFRRVEPVAGNFLEKAKELLTVLQAQISPAVAEATAKVERELNALLFVGGDKAKGFTDRWKNSAPQARVKLVEELLRNIVLDTELPPDLAQRAQRTWLDALDAHGRLQTAIMNAAIVT